MAKYKHVPSGIIAEKIDVTNGLSEPAYRTDKGEFLPSWIVQGKDWEEVKEIYFGVHKEMFSIVEVSTTKNDIDCSYTFFRTQPEAEEYIMNNKPCLSLNDVFKTLNRESPLGQQIIATAKSKLAIP